MPWSPLAAGVLAHSWNDRSDPREQSDVFLKALFRGREEEKADKAIVGRVEEVAKKKGVSMAQVAIAWTLRQGGGTTPILGLDTTDRVNQAVEALNIGLTEEEIKYMGEPYLPKKVAGY
jgi:versiconal hemiacetal acetate reductase